MLQFDTNTVRDHERFTYWREAVCETYVQLGCEADGRSMFWGDIRLHRLPRLSVSFVTSAPQEVHRRRRDVARANDAFFLVSLQLKNRSAVNQHARQAIIEPGDFALYSSADPYVLELPEAFRQLVLQIPREDLLSRLPNADLLTGRRVSAADPVGGLVSRSLVQFAEAIDRPSDTVQQFMCDSIVDMVATGLASLDQSRLELAVPQQRTASRARAFIRSRLDDPDLDRSDVAQAVGLSLRRLSEIFAGEGLSVAAFIREERLRRVARMLRDPRYRRLSVSAIALSCGFNNLQHFSRAFRQHYDTTPRDYRNGPV